jgi:outer membrane lipoprotein SlyB
MPDTPSSAASAPGVNSAKSHSGSDPIVLCSGSRRLKVMENANMNLMFVGLFVVSGLWAGCAWDNSPPPYHSVISYDPSRAHNYVSVVPVKNAPSIRDWKADEDVGIDYGSKGYGAAGPSAAPTAGQAAGGAVSTPSGASSGGAAGTTTQTTSAPPSNGLNSTLSRPTSTQYPTFSTSSPTNTSSGVIFTNRYAAPSNSLLSPGSGTPTP